MWALEVYVPLVQICDFPTATLLIEGCWVNRTCNMNVGTWPERGLCEEVQVESESQELHHEQNILQQEGRVRLQGGAFCRLSVKRVIEMA